MQAIFSGNTQEEALVKKLASKSSAAKRMEKYRRKKGIKTRDEYLENSLSRIEPWKKEGISRATWYRKHKKSSYTGAV